MTAWARSNKLKYSTIISQINSDVALRAQYDQALAARDEWAKEAVLAELRLIGLTDVRTLLNTDGAMLPKDQWPEEIARAVSSLEVYEEYFGSGSDRRLIGYTKKIKLWDKMAALEKVGKAIGVLVDKSEIEHKGIGHTQIIVIRPGGEKQNVNITRAEIQS